MGFQTQVNQYPAPAVAGDFCSANPRAVVLGGPGQYVAPTDGLTVGRFAWANPDSGVVSQSYVSGDQIGFLHRENQALITEFLGEASTLVPAGNVVTLFDQGEFWAEFAAGAAPGDLVFADPDTGAPIASSTAASVTGSAGASFTGAIATNVLTVSALTGVLTPGDILAGAGITVGTVLGAQLTGPTGGAGTYTVTHANVASEAMTVSSTHLQVTAVGSGVLGVGSALSGSGVTVGTVITAQDSGTPGGIGVYSISPVQRFASTTVTETGIATGYTVRSTALAGELAKISSW